MAKGFIAVLIFKPKKAGNQFDPPPCGFSKNLSSKERVKL